MDNKGRKLNVKGVSDWTGHIPLEMEIQGGSTCNGACRRGDLEPRQLLLPEPHIHRYGCSSGKEEEEGIIRFINEEGSSPRILKFRHCPGNFEFIKSNVCIMLRRSEQRNPGPFKEVLAGSCER